MDIGYLVTYCFYGKAAHSACAAFVGIIQLILLGNSRRKRVSYATNRQKMISKIHIAQQQLGLDDDVYRDLLAQATGKRSCKDMDDGELAAVLNLLQQKGFGADVDAKAYQRTPLHFAEHGAMMRKIGALLTQTGKSWAYAHGIARKMFGVETVQRCDGEQMRKVLAALNYQAKREAHKAA
nr:MAG TPA: Protein of unknown function (DUF1018) [Caudoviricetes sp.]